VTPRTVTDADILAKAMEVLEIETQGLQRLKAGLDSRFVEMVRIIARSTGRVIISGIGKSGIIGRKISGTLNSTGTRSLFLHPVEALHGDLGQVSPGDVLIALSNSGETGEINALIPSIRAIGCAVIAFTGAPGSTLSRLSDLVIDVAVPREACPLGLAPTASSTAMLAMGDALAVVLLEQKQFNTDDFKKIHPAGLLGRRLASRVEDLMVAGAPQPVACEGQTMDSVVEVIDHARLGAALVINAHGTLVGIVTDGDVRRMLVRHPRRLAADTKVEEVMTRAPRCVGPQTPTYDALNLMEQHQITVLPVTDPAGCVAGILHLHDILGKGRFKFTAEPPE
jgi:arabinose-5-phosphate isomerase